MSPFSTTIYLYIYILHGTEIFAFVMFCTLVMIIRHSSSPSKFYVQLLLHKVPYRTDKNTIPLSSNSTTGSKYII
jgi:hypothetical protein